MNVVRYADRPDRPDDPGMRLPAGGSYVVPEMLAPLDVANGVGRHVEPNVCRHVI